jgi:hypothetical protein
LAGFGAFVSAGFAGWLSVAVGDLGATVATGAGSGEVPGELQPAKASKPAANAMVARIATRCRALTFPPHVVAFVAGSTLPTGSVGQSQNLPHRMGDISVFSPDRAYLRFYGDRMGRVTKTLLAVTASAAVLNGLAGVAVAGPPAAMERLQRTLLAENEMPGGYHFESFYFGVDGGGPEPGEPCATTTPVQAASARDRYGSMASVSFRKGADDGPSVSESITMTGRAAAGAAVKRYQDILDRCPTSTDVDFPMTYKRWDLPAFGDTSVGYVLTMGELRFRTAMVAHDDLLTIFTKMAGTDEDGADLKKVVQAGVKKLRTSDRTPAAS